MYRTAVDADERERLLDEAATEWLKALENGASADEDHWLARYPLVAAELQEFFAGQIRLDRLTSSLREALAAPAEAHRANAPTVGAFATVSPVATFGPRTVFGEYELLAEIARGGMGVVYKARQKRLNRTVAVKMILAGQFANKDDVRRFLAEAEAAAALDHSGIVPVYESGEIDGQHFFSMGFVDGESLATKLTAGPLLPREAAELLAQVADAVQYAHQQGVIHRDLKPGNILIDKGGHPRVTDFGLAKRITGDSGLTHTGQALGTPSYMPPEQAAGRSEEIGLASDVYSLGAVLYATVTGRPPFQAASQFDTLRQVIEQEPVPPRQLNASVPPDLETITLKCLRKEPHKRYATAGQFADELRRFLADRPIEARRSSHVERLLRWSRRNRSLAASLTVLFGLLAFVTVASILAAAHFSKLNKVQAALALDNGELAKKFKTAANDANSARRQAETTLADMQTTHGLLAAERGDASTAILWFANAASLTPYDQARQDENRLRAKNWLSRATLPIAAIPLNQPAKMVKFQPSGPRILALSTGGQCLIWDCRDDTPLPWTEKLANIAAACWSPDGSQVALAVASGEVQIRAVGSGEIAATVEHPEAASAVAFTPDGSRLAIASKLVRIWRLEPQPRSEHDWPHPAVVDWLVFDSAGERLVTACRDKLVRVYPMTPEADQPAPLYAPWPHDPADPCPPALFDGDRCLLTIAKKTGPPQLGQWDMRTGGAVSYSKIDHFAVHWFDRVVTHADGKLLALLGDHSFKVWDFATAPARSFVGTHRNEVQNFCFSPDGSLALSVSADQKAQLWSVAEGKQLCAPLRHAQQLTHGGFSSDGRQMFTVQSGGLIRVWKVPESGYGAVRPVEWQVAAPVRPRVSFDGRLAVAGIPHEFPYYVPHAYSNKLNVIDLDSGKVAGPTIELAGMLVDACVCADNRKVAAVSVDNRTGSFTVRDAVTGDLIVASATLPSPPCSIAARPGVAEVAVLCRGGELLVLGDRDGRARLTLKQSAGQSQRARVAYTADGSTLVVVTDNDNSVVVRDADDGRARMPPIRPVLEKGPLRGIDLSADGKFLLTAVNGKNAVQVWDLATGRALCQPLLHPGDAFGLFAARFTPDGQHLLSASKDGQARYWDWRNETLACPALQHDDEVYDVAFSRDGQHAITISRDGTVRAWELITGKLVAPPMALSYSLNTIGNAGDRLLVADGARRSCFSIDLEELFSPPDAGTEQLRTLGELASRQRIAVGDVTGLTAAEWTARWQRLRERAQTNAESAQSLSKRLDSEPRTAEKKGIIERAMRSHVLNELARLRPNDPLIHAALARQAETNGEAELARAHRQIAQRIYEGELARQPLNETLANECAEILFDSHSPWRVVKPREMKSQGGATLKRLADNSVLVSGVNPAQDVYIITAACPSEHLAAVKLEIFPDMLSAGGVLGRSDNGNFVLTDITLTLSGECTAARRPPLSLASADFSQMGFDVMRAIDDEPGTGWAVWPKTGTPHQAVFNLDKVEDVSPSAELTTVLSFQSAYDQHAVKHFRLSVTDDCYASLAAYLKAAMDRGELQGYRALGAAYVVYGDAPAALRWLARVPNDASTSAVVQLMLALAQHEVGHSDAHASYARAMALLAERPVAEEVQALARRAAVEVAGLSPGEAVTAVGRAQDSARLASLTAAIARTPSNWEAYRARGNYYAGQARWKEAADDWRQIVRISPNEALFWLDLAVLLAASGDRAAYSEHCRAMLKHFADTEDPGVAEKTAKACSLLPDALDDHSKVVEMADRGLRLLSPNDAWRPVFDVGKALADYRRGDFPAANDRLASLNKQALSPEYLAFFETVCALVSHQLGNDAEAQRHLSAGTDRIHRHVPDFSRAETFHGNWVIAEVLRREAAATLDQPNTLKPAEKDE